MEPVQNDTRPELVVGVGASAGGLDACKRLLANVPADHGLAFVVVMHLDPSQQSHIAEFLGKVTSSTVRQVTGGERVEPNHVYVIAPATSLRIREDVLEVTAREMRYPSKPIDDFFSALAADQGGRAVGVILSGTGNNGSEGLKEIHRAGGLCLVQEAATAEYDGMPSNAVATGVADAVLPPEKMGEMLLDYAGPEHVRPVLEALGEPAAEAGEGPGGFEGILALLAERYGVNFSDYKPGTLARRTARRMDLMKMTNWDDYLGHLRDHPEEVADLYGDVLIDVTRFFRDRAMWEYLEREVVPPLLEQHTGDTPLRVWSAGCATGEEAYGLAMVFLEQIEKQGGGHRLQVFGSDVSHEALAVARRGVYPAHVVEDISPERLRRFFRRTGDQYQVDRSLRDLVTFAAHNLLADPPFANLDLVVCRNVLIYLKPEAQERLLELFHFALRPGGVLWLGNAETVGRRSDLYDTMAGAHRLYRSIRSTRAGRPAVPGWVASRAPVPGVVPQPELPPRQPSVTRLIERFVLEHLTVPAVAVNRSLEILHFFGPTEPYLKQPSGEARMDLLSWVRQGLYGRLRAGLLEAIEENRSVTVSDLRMERETGRMRVEVVIEPVVAFGIEGVFLVSFREVPPVREPLEASPEEGATDDSLIHDLEQELLDTRLELQNTVEQLETANEEYRASHEELLSLNEELQSSNEELEMSKEELQSLNEELTTINRQLEERNEELRVLSADLSNLLVSAGIPVLFLDRQFRVRRFTPACSQIMRIVDTDIGRSLDHVKLDVRDDNLLADAERVLEQLTPLEVEVPTEDGQWFLRKIVPYRTETDHIDGVCITFQDITAQKIAGEESERARRFAEAVIRSSPVSMLALDENLRVTMVNEAFLETFHTREADTVGHAIFDLGEGQWDIPELRDLLEGVLPEQEEIRGYDVDHEFGKIGRRAMRVSATLIPDPEGLVLVSIEDITDLRKAEEAAEARSTELVQEHRRKDEFLAMLAHELRNPLMALATGIEVLGRGPGSPGLVDTMKRQADRMSALLDQLLDVGRVVLGKLELDRRPVDVTEIVREGAEIVGPMIESAGQQLDLSLAEPGGVLVHGDPLRLSQVVENLLANASKFTPPEGRIWVTVKATDGEVEIAVRDTGAGMEPDLVESAFDLFTQGPAPVDREKGGLGMGLPLVRALVEMHGGRVRARSEGPGKGSEFVVTLSRMRSTQPAPGTDAPPETPAPPVRRILVVDDEQDTAMLLADLLTLEGQEVRVAHDGSGAFDTARTFRPDMVLLDLGMPGEDGYQVAAKLRDEHGNGMFIVALSGYRRDQEKLDAAGFDEHLLKPPDIEVLVGMLAEDGPVDRKLSGG